MEYGSVKAATEVHPEIEYELRLRAQEQHVREIEDGGPDEPDTLLLEPA